MKKNQRLKNKILIQKVINRRNTQGSKNFVVYIDEAEKLKIGVGASKKSGNAVNRNLYKRWIRNIIRPYIKELKNYNVFIVAKPNVKNLDFNQFKYDLLKVLKRHSIFKKGS